MYGKADKIPNKGPSTNDFTNGYKQKLDSLKNYDDTSIKKEISNIKTEQVTQNNNISNLQKENEELKEENKRLREDLNGLPSGTVSGENIDITDSAEMRCELNIRGNSKQKTSTQGKNRLDLRDATYMVSDVNVIKNGSTLTLNGTMNTSGNLLNTVGDMYSFVYLGKFKTGTYRFSKFIISGKYSKNESIGVGSFACYIRKKDKELLGEILGSASNREGVTITLKEETDLYIQIFCNAGAIFDNYVIGFQLEEGSTTTDLEEFKPNMPSPDYPSEVECCGDNMNLFDKENVVEDHFVSNNIVANKEWCYSILQGLKSEEKITISGGRCILSYFNKDTNISYQDITDKTITIPNNTTKVYASTLKTNLNTLKIEKDIVSTSYSPYGQGCVNEIICNENLLPMKAVNTTVNDVKITINEDKSITLNGTATNDIYLDINKENKMILNKNQKYIMSIGIKLPSDLRMKTRLANKAQDVISIDVGESQKSYTALEKQEVYTYIQLLKGATFNNLTVYPMITKGTTISSYIEHKSQTYTIPTQKPFRAIGNTRDTFIKKNNKWYERHFIHRVVFNGTENWSYNVGEKIVYRQIDNNTQYGKNDNILFMSNYLKESTFNNHSKLDDIVFAWSSQPYVCIKATSKISGAETAKSWIKGLYDSGSPLIIDRVLITPTDIECTEEQNKILDKIENEAKTYKNITHVYSIDKVSSNAEITYKKDLETLFSNALTKEV